MNSFLAHLANFTSFFPVNAASGANDAVARDLMERAEADAGRNPHESQELRSAAYAYLTVVR